MKESYFIDHIIRLIDSYSKKYENFIIMGDFNMQECDEHMKGMLVSYNLNIFCCHSYFFFNFFLSLSSDLYYCYIYIIFLNFVLRQL